MIVATRDFQWLTAQTGVEFTPSARGMADVVDGVQRGVVACDLWGGTSAHVHFAARCAAACRVLAAEFFKWAFGPAGREVLIAIVAESNHVSRRLVVFYGFKQVHVIKDGWRRGVDFLLYEMRRDDCRWLKEAHDEFRYTPTR